MKGGATTMQRHRHDPSKNLVGFVVCDVEYAVPIACVKEIANPHTVVPLPHAPRSVVGVADYRGEVVSVVDMRARFGLPVAPITRKTKWIIVDVGITTASHGSPVQPGAARATDRALAPSGRLVALVVDAVTDVFGTGGAELRPAPELGGGSDARGIAGVTMHASGLVFVLDANVYRDLADPLGEGLGGVPSSGQNSDGQDVAAAARSLPARTFP